MINKIYMNSYKKPGSTILKDARKNYVIKTAAIWLVNMETEPVTRATKLV